MSGHGRVRRRPDGTVADCLGPGACKECDAELEEFRKWWATERRHPDGKPVDAIPYWEENSWIDERTGFEMFSKSSAVTLERRAREAETRIMELNQEHNARVAQLETEIRRLKLEK